MSSLSQIARLKVLWELGQAEAASELAVECCQVACGTHSHWLRVLGPDVHGRLSAEDKLMRLQFCQSLCTNLYFRAVHILRSMGALEAKESSCTALASKYRKVADKKFY
jgi:hypothetical protein